MDPPPNLRGVHPTSEMTDQTEETQSTELMAAEALVGMACILMGSDMLNRAVKKLRHRGITVGTVTESLTESFTGDHFALDRAGESIDAPAATQMDG